MSECTYEYVCMNVCTYECMNACMSACMHLHMRLYTSFTSFRVATYIIIHLRVLEIPWAIPWLSALPNYSSKKQKYIYHYISLLMVNIQHWFRHPKSETILSDRKLTFTTVLWSGLRLTLRNFYLYMSVLKWRGGTSKPWVSILKWSKDLDAFGYPYDLGNPIL